MSDKNAKEKDDRTQQQKLRQDVSAEDFKASVIFYRTLFSFLARNIELASMYPYVDFISEMESYDDFDRYLQFLVSHDELP